MSKTSNILYGVMGAVLLSSLNSTNAFAAIFIKYDGIMAETEAESVEWVRGQPDDVTLKRGTRAGPGEVQFTYGVGKSNPMFVDSCKDKKSYDRIEFSYDLGVGGENEFVLGNAETCGCSFQEVSGLGIKSKSKYAVETISFCYQRITWN